MKQWAIDKGVPDLARLLETFGRNLSAKFNCHRVGRITAFDSDTLTCKVKLLDKFVFNDTEQDYVEFTGMPLLIYATETAGLTLGNVVGAECLVHFNDTDIDNFLQTGEAYAPNSLRSHDFADGFVELRPFDHVAAQKITYDSEGVALYNGNTKVQLKDDGSAVITNGSAVITLSGGDIAITGNVTISGDLTVNKTITATTDVVTNNISLKQHTHTGGTIDGNTGAPIATGG